MKLFLILLLVFSPTQVAADCVILLHGLARTDSSMKKLEETLQEAGYKTVNIDYPSRRHPIEALSQSVIPSALKQCPENQNIDFVTHSLVGILVRQYLDWHEIPKLSRVVMLGPPNQGSEVVDKLGRFPGFKFINGEAGLQLGTGELSLPNRLGKAEFDLGIIAGTNSINLILSMLIPDTDDGKVSVERTKLEGMNDHIEMPVSHPFLMQDDDVIEQVLHYLRYGYFKRDQMESFQGPITLRRLTAL